MRGGLLVLTMNRPESRNAMDAALCSALADQLAGAAEDRGVRAVILTGAGGAFSVGGDVKAMNKSTGRDMPEAARVAALRARMEASRLLHEMPKPTVAAIDGPAAGAGLSLALACDFRICSRTAKLTTAFARVGLSGDYGGTYFLPRLVGPAKARELYLLSPILSGEQAKAIVVTELASPYWPAGEHWQRHVRVDVTRNLKGVEVLSRDASGLAAHWSSIMGVPVTAEDGRHVINV